MTRESAPRVIRRSISFWPHWLRISVLAVIVVVLGVLCALSVIEDGGGAGAVWVGLAIVWLTLWALAVAVLALLEFSRVSRLERRFALESWWNSQDLAEAQIAISEFLVQLERAHPMRSERFAAFQALPKTGTADQRLRRGQVFMVLNALEQIAETVDKGYADREVLESIFGHVMAFYRRKWRFLIDGRQAARSDLHGDDRPWAYLSKMADEWDASQ